MHTPPQGVGGGTAGLPSVTAHPCTTRGDVTWEALFMM